MRKLQRFDLLTKEEGNYQRERVIKKEKRTRVGGLLHVCGQTKREDNDGVVAKGRAHWKPREDSALVNTRKRVSQKQE